MRILKLYFLIGLLALVYSCKQSNTPTSELATSKTVISPQSDVYLVVLGTVQDAGSPHIACSKACCVSLFSEPDPLRKVVSLGIIDTNSQQSFLFEATPDISTQLKQLKQFSGRNQELPNGIFLTHAHIGHYTGLQYLGKEATNADRVPVYAMPKMQDFLERNGPWDQLVTRKNIVLRPLQNKETITLSPQLSVTPFVVPHRDEYSETVGYRIEGPNKRVLFVPDIDKWSKWETSIIDAVKSVDYAFIDATFYDGEELNTRDISEIPHPFVIESMALFKGLPSEEKKKIHFIHFNHTNALLDKQSKASEKVIANGFNIATIHQVLSL